MKHRSQICWFWVVIHASDGLIFLSALLCRSLSIAAHRSSNFFLFTRVLSEMGFIFNFRNNICSGSVLQIFSWMLSIMPVNKLDFPTIYPIKRWKNKSYKMVNILAEEWISFLFTYGKQSIWILFANCFLLTVFSKYENHLFWQHLVLNLQKCTWWVLAIVNIITKQLYYQNNPIHIYNRDAVVVYVLTGWTACFTPAQSQESVYKR